MAVRNTPATSHHMQTALMAGKHTYADLAAISGLARPTVARWVKALKTVKAIHISGWAEDERGRPLVMQFSWGNKKDVPRPGAKGSAERQRRYRARQELGL